MKKRPWLFPVILLCLAAVAVVSVLLKWVNEDLEAAKRCTQSIPGGFMHPTLKPEGGYFCVFHAEVKKDE